MEDLLKSYILKYKINFWIRLLFIIAISFAIHSCSSGSKNNASTDYQVITIDKSVFDKQKDYSRIIKNIDLIALETVKESIIGRIDNIKEYKDHYYIFDRHISKSLFVFNKNGRFVKRIHDIGKGPHEYTRLYSFSIDNYSNQIIICAGWPAKILKYNLFGEFEEEVIISERGIDALEVFDESKYIVKYPGEKEQIFLINKQGKALKQLYVNTGPKAGLLKPFIKYNEKVLYHTVYNDTIYNLSEKGIEPWLYIDFKERRITSDIIAKIESETWRLRRSVTEPSHIMTHSLYYAESDDFIYFIFTFGYKEGRGGYNLFYTKKTNSILVFPPGSILDEGLNKKYGFLNNFNLMDVKSTGQFIGQLSPIDLLESIESIDNLVKEGFITINGQKSIQEIKNIDEMANPVIALYTFRDSF